MNKLLSALAALSAIAALAAPAAASPAGATNTGPALSAAAEPTPRPDRDPQPAAPLDDIGAAALLSDAELTEARGGYTIIINEQTLIGIVQGNYFGGDYVAGAVSFNDSAFSNFTGLLALAINTGLQSNALAGMSVTINVND